MKTTLWSLALQEQINTYDFSRVFLLPEKLRHCAAVRNSLPACSRIFHSEKRFVFSLKRTVEKAVAPQNSAHNGPSLIRHVQKRDSLGVINNRPHTFLFFNFTWNPFLPFGADSFKIDQMSNKAGEETIRSWMRTGERTLSRACIESTDAALTTDAPPPAPGVS